jgi:hypothetical protein
VSELVQYRSLLTLLQIQLATQIVNHILYHARQAPLGIESPIRACLRVVDRVWPCICNALAHWIGIVRDIEPAVGTALVPVLIDGVSQLLGSE